jgi:two-component system phosphate regulon sensor histidine kinase PhoR
MKFRTKLLIIYIITSAVLTGILAMVFSQYGENRLRHSLFEQLLPQAEMVANDLGKLTSLRPGTKITAIVKEVSRIAKARITIVAADGSVIGDSDSDYRKMANHRQRPEIEQAMAGRAGYSFRFSRTLDRHLIYVAYPIRHAGRIVGVVRLARHQAEFDNTLAQLRWIIFGGIGFTLLFPLLLGTVVLSRMTQPILELQKMAKKISQGDLSARVRFFGSDELAELGLVFNSMAQQLSDSFTTIYDEKHTLEVILENLMDGILVIDRHLKILLANPAAQNILGINPRNARERPLLEVVLNHHLLQLIQEVNRYQESIESELVIHYPGNKQIQVFLAPLKDKQGRLFGSIAVLHDLTRLRRLERVRQDFVANVSHELRTPITTIKIMTETLLNGAWQEQEIFLRYLRSINSESDRLTALINDLLALAKLDAKVEAAKAPVDLVALIHEMEERFVPVPGKTPHFAINLPEAELPLVYGNHDQLKQVLINLLDNAFKYTPSDGQVRISAWPDSDMVKVAVADTGIGIPPEDLDRIFERFYRVDKARSREIGGTGLGLSIVKNIIEAYGGRVEVESSLNRGSVFSFTVPVYGDQLRVES